MKRVISTIIILSSLTLGISHSQTKPEASLDVLGFADNREYKSSYITDQSMMGMRLSPELGLGFDEHHHVRIGVSLLQEFGREMGKEDVAYTAYYLYEKNNFTLHFGSFPRRFAVGDFPAAFFYDSLTYYRPNVQGLSWRYERGRNHASVFLDWTGRQAAHVRESFLLGGEGIYRYKYFYGKFHYYMCHYALRAEPAPDEHIHDNGLLHLALGIDAGDRTFCDTLYINAGFLMGQERRRNDPSTGGWHAPKGILVELKAQWKRLEIRNTFYHGDGLMFFYNTPYNEGGLYWGDPYYRAKTYNRTDLSAYLIRSPRVKAYFDYSFHWAEGYLSHQQQFIIRCSL